MDSAQVGIFEKANKVSLSSLLESKNSGTLESKVGLEVLSDLTNKALEWQLADQKLGGLLVSADLTESNGTWAVTVRFLYTTGSRGGLASSLGSELLAWCLATSGLSCGLLSTSHLMFED
jgi:hypothetical protein